MPQWLTKASTVIVGRTAEPDQPYQVRCACGRPLRGMRKTLRQVVVCPDCSERVFVLPANIYPYPADARKKASQAADRPARLPGETPAGERISKVGKAVREFAASQARRSREFVTPFRLVLLCIAAAIGLTIYSVAASRKAEQARQALQDAPAAAKAALAEGDLVTAGEKYRMAAEAARRLKRNDAEAQLIYQAERELDTVASLSPDAILGIIEYLESFPPRQRDEAFRNRYENRWVVFEADATRPPGTSVTLQVEYPLVVNGQGVGFEGLGPLFAQLGKDAKPQKVVFAAQLRTCSHDERRKRWMIGLKTSSAYFWRGLETYRALGLLSDDPEERAAVETIIQQQASRQESTP